MCDDEKNKGYFVKEMTYEEAANWIRAHRDLSMNVMDSIASRMAIEALESAARYKDMAIEALEKQIPKKPYFSEETASYYCPVCRRFKLADHPKENGYVYNFCPNCGNAIDMLEVEDGMQR